MLVDALGRWLADALTAAAAELWVPRMMLQRCRVKEQVYQPVESLAGLVGYSDMRLVAPGACG